MKHLPVVVAVKFLVVLTLGLNGGVRVFLMLLVDMDILYSLCAPAADFDVLDEQINKISCSMDFDGSCRLFQSAISAVLVCACVRHRHLVSTTRKAAMDILYMLAVVYPRLSVG